MLKVIKRYATKTRRGEIFVAKIEGETNQATQKWTLEIHKQTEDGGWNRVYESTDGTFYRSKSKLWAFKKGSVWVEQ